MNGWTALSDQSISPKGSQLIANYGGPGKGITFMVERLKAHHKPHELVFDAEHFFRFRQFTLRYEITCNIQGVLMHDPTQQFAEAAVRAGLLEELVYTLEAEQDSCSPMWATCSAIAYMLRPNTASSKSYKARLLDIGAVEPARQALAGCRPFKPGGYFMAGKTWEELQPADMVCNWALMLLTS
mmetsp:Transcript_58158/g.182219  ORF Transcript_58158/g.182219 Transcript_58158/m.182219 type:complete len:184 (+) Transcript_58158:259-810(+)